MPTKCFTKKTNSGKNYTACVDTKTFKKKTKKATRKKNKITIPKMKKLSSHDAIRNVPALRNLIGSYVMVDSQQRGSAVSALSGIVNRQDMTEVHPFRNATLHLDNQDDTDMVRQFKYSVGSARGDFATSIFGNVRRQDRKDNFATGFVEADIGKRNVKRSKAQKKKDRLVSRDARRKEVNRNYNINLKRKKKRENDEMRMRDLRLKTEVRTRMSLKKTRIHSLL